MMIGRGYESCPLIHYTPKRRMHQLQNNMFELTIKESQPILTNIFQFGVNEEDIKM